MAGGSAVHRSPPPRSPYTQRGTRDQSRPNAAYRRAPCGRHGRSSRASCRGRQSLRHGRIVGTVRPGPRSRAACPDRIWQPFTAFATLQSGAAGAKGRARHQRTVGGGRVRPRAESGGQNERCPATPHVSVGVAPRSQEKAIGARRSWVVRGAPASRIRIEFLESGRSDMRFPCFEGLPRCHPAPIVTTSPTATTPHAPDPTAHRHANRLPTCCCR
jgi:hypothetical protein